MNESYTDQFWTQYQEGFPTADPRTKHWLLLNNSPVAVWLLSAFYLLFVWLGPKYMSNRKPLALNSFLVVYNLGLMLLSVYMFVEIFLSTWQAGYDYICAAYNAQTIQDPREYRVAAVLWWYFFSKAIELLDTVLMVVRKKNSQISFLHVFHHVSMLNIWWWVTMFIPGGLSYFGAWLNSFIHIVMYLYYGLSAIPSLREKLWWKKYLTRMQLIQFCITLTHTLNSLYSKCDFPTWGKNLLAGYMVIMLILFSNFYIHAYIKRREIINAKKDSHANGKLD